MEIRVLRYFLAVAREENITKAAEALHVTQPTLSRQLSELEEEIGVVLFERGSRKIRLTEEGVFLRRRAEEIVSLAERTMEELTRKEEELSGTVTIGTGGFEANQLLFRAMNSFRKEHPHVYFSVFTGTADTVKERMDHGTADLAVLLEPVDTEQYAYIRLKDYEQFVAMMRADDELASKESISPKDLKKRHLILPGRKNVKAQLVNWMGVEEKKLIIDMVSDLGLVVGDAVYASDAVSIQLKGALPFADPGKLVQKPLNPSLKSSVVIACRRGIPQTKTTEKFMEYLKCFLGME